MLAFVDFVEDMFLQAFEQWRAQVIGDRKIVLIGHSLGGYLSACYAEQSGFARNLASLVLASPVGVSSWRPEHAECDNERMVRRSTLKKTFGKDYSELKHNVTPYSFLPTDTPWEELPLHVRVAGTLLKNFLVWMWGLRLCTHDVIGRLPFPAFMCLPVFARASHGRFQDNGQWSSQAEGFSKHNVVAYLYEIYRLPTSGDYAITVMLEPGPWARKPLEMRIPKFCLEPPAGGIPVVFVYGDIDWMDRDGTKRLLQKFPHLKCVECDKSGHAMYMDNPFEFARCVRNALEPAAMATK
jgi:cardiolipin-specific phospholipase